MKTFEQLKEYQKIGKPDRFVFNNKYEKYISERKTFKSFVTEEKKKNYGDISEPILGAAVVARFMLPEKEIKITNIKTILKKLLVARGKLPKEIEFRRSDKKERGVTVNITDKIKFRVAIPAPSWEYISDMKNWDGDPKVKKIFQSSMKYANNDKRLKYHAIGTHINRVINSVFVNSDGTGDQKGTKADIKLTIDGKPLDQQISLKTTGGEQFDQVAGITFDHQIKIFKKLSLDVSSKRKDYDKIFQSMDMTKRFISREDSKNLEGSAIAKNMRDASEPAYKEAAKQLQAIFKKGDAESLKVIARFLKGGITKGDDTIEMVKLDKGSYKKAKFGPQFEKAVEFFSTKFEAKYFRINNTDPILKVFDKALDPTGEKGEALIFKIRGKFTFESTNVKDPVTKKSRKEYKCYFRNIVEAGPVLFDLAIDS